MKTIFAGNIIRENKGGGETRRTVQFETFDEELDYPQWLSFQRCLLRFQTLFQDNYWNVFICVLVLVAIILVAIESWDPCAQAIDIIYNIAYMIHVLGIAYHLSNCLVIGFFNKFSFLLDLISYAHYVITLKEGNWIKLGCYYIRLHRPLAYLWALSDKNLKSTVVGTALKYCYIFMVLRVTWAISWLHIDKIEELVRQEHNQGRTIYLANRGHSSNDSSKTAAQFVTALYVVNKMFIPIGPTITIKNDVERLACLLVMVSGCLVVTGAAVASLSLIISIFLRPEENFRARYRLIMKEMCESHVPADLRDKVETFYKMYWHKQRAVSATQLLPTFPPSLCATVDLDIYFEATQKSRVLRDLAHQFLSEVAKNMETIHYIPGDAIIKRSSKKSSIIYITYGDIEMVTAEDDSTALLRMTRGTLLSGGAGSATAAAARAHVTLRAATFCTAHVLRAAALWRAVVRCGRHLHQGARIRAAFAEHFEKVRRYHSSRIPVHVKYKSSILDFKRNLMALKEARDSDGRPYLARTDVFLEIAGCYIMRNREDVSLNDEADAICLRPVFPCILQPNSSLQMAWNSFVSILVLVVCFTYPYYLVFKKSVSIQFRSFDYVVTAVFVLDIIVHLSTGADVEEGVPITLAQTSSQQMRSYWFVLDVMGTVPIFEFIGSGHFAGINKLLKLPKNQLHAVRVYQVFRLLKSLEEVCVYQSNLVRFLSYTLLLVVGCYVVASLQQGFMCYQFGYCQVTNFTHSPYWDKKPLDESSVRHRLSFGLYWALSMVTFTSHMETWGTDNWNNVLYTMIVLEVCIVLHVFIQAVYSATIMVTSAFSEEYDACIANVKNVLSRSGVDPMLEQRFITYLQLCWYTDKAYSMTHKKSIFFDLPPHVYQDILARQRSKYILCIPFMKLLNKEDLKNVSTKARMFYTSPNEILLNTGDISNEMYVIKQGICEILNPDTKSVVGVLGQRSHFGVIESLLRVPAFYTVRAVTHIQVFSISRKHLLGPIETVPQLKDAIDFAKEQPEYATLHNRRDRFVHYEPPQAPANTSRFRLPRKHEMDYEFLHPFKQLGTFSVLRYIFPRFTIRPDGKYLIRYEWFRACCAFASATLVPGYSYLVLEFPFLSYIFMLLDFSAYFDLFQRMLVGYFNEHGVLVYHPASTAAYYTKGAFIVDLFACLPLETLETPKQEKYRDWYKVTLTHQYLMLNRLIQLYRLPSAMMILKDYIERKDILLVIRAMPLFMALLNVLTCVLVLRSADIFFLRDRTKFVIKPHKDEGGSWIELFKNSFRFETTTSPWKLHLATYFWVVYETTTTGYNTITPSHVNQMIVLYFGMVIGAMTITYVSVRIISIRANVNTVLAEYQENMNDMVTYMQKERLDQNLLKEVVDYHKYNWNKLGGVDYRNVLKLCDQITLRTDAILHLYGPTFSQCPLLSECDVSVLRILGRAVRSVYFLKRTQLYEIDDILRDVYLVDYGSINVLEQHVDTIVRLERGSIFGNLEGANTVKCPVSFAAGTDVHLLRIHANAFHNIIADLPDIQEKLMKYRVLSENYIEGHTEQDTLKTEFTETPIVMRNRRKLVKVFRYKNLAVTAYLILVCMICVYADVYNAGFQDNRPALIVALYVLDMAYVAKIIAHLTLPYFAAGDEQLRLVLLESRASYYMTDFKYDLLSCTPIELIGYWSNSNAWMYFSILRLNRMFRIVTIYKCLMQYHERLSINLSFTTVVSTLIWATLFVHVNTCLWNFIGMEEEKVQYKSSWFYDDAGNPWCYNTYVCSLYFVLTTFTQNGVGDIMPKKISEIMFVSALMIVSTMLYLVYVGEFSNIIQYQSFRSFSYYSKYLELQDFLRNNRVSKNLVKMVNRYSLHLWQEARGEQLPHFLRRAPHCIKLRVMSAAYLHHLAENPVFQNCEPAFLRQLVGCFRYYTYNEDMFVVKEGEITDSMYFIHSGQVIKTQENQDDLPKKYSTRDYFGVLQGLQHDLPFTNSYCTTHKSQILSLFISDWESLIVHFPSSRDSIYRHLQSIDPEEWKSSGRDSSIFKPGDFNKKRIPRSSFMASSNRPPPYKSFQNSANYSPADRSIKTPEYNIKPTSFVNNQQETDNIEFQSRSTEETTTVMQYTPLSIDPREESEDSTPNPRSQSESNTTLIDRLSQAVKILLQHAPFYSTPELPPNSSASVPQSLNDENFLAEIGTQDTLLMEEDKEATSDLFEKVQKGADITQNNSKDKLESIVDANGDQHQKNSDNQATDESLALVPYKELNIESELIKDEENRTSKHVTYDHILSRIEEGEEQESFPDKQEPPTTSTSEITEGAQSNENEPKSSSKKSDPDL